MKITYKTLGIFIVVSLFVGIGGAKLLGVWKTEGTKQPVAIRDGEFAGMPNPSDIRGSYAWNDIAEAFDFEVELLLEAFGATDPASKVNTLETVFEAVSLPAGTEIGTDAVKLFVSLLTGLPHLPEETTILPYAAIEILREKGKTSPELIEEVATRAWNPETLPAVAADGGAEQTLAQPQEAAALPIPNSIASTTSTVATTTTTTSTTVHIPSPANTSGTSGGGSGAVAGTIVGKTTFKDLKTWGLSDEQIKSVTGGEIGHDLAVIRDWATSKGLSFSELKTGLQALLDAAK